MNYKGFTLVELLIVVAIISILSMVAYPSYRESVVRGNRVTVQGDLEAAAAAMANFRAQNFTYNNANMAAVFRTRSPASGTQQYELVFATGATNTTPASFIIYARPVSGGAQSGDGALGINEQGQRCWNKASDATCTPGDAGQMWK